MQSESMAIVVLMFGTKNVYRITGSPVPGKKTILRPERCRAEDHLANAMLRLALHVDQILEHFINSRDDAGVRLEAALRDDEIGELISNVDV